MTKVDKNVKNRILSIIEAFLITFAIFDIGGFSASDMLLGLIFIVIYLIIDAVKRGEMDRIITSLDHRKKKAINTIALIWTGSYLIYAGGRLGAGMENKLFVLVYFVLAALGIFMGIRVSLCIIIPRLAVRKPDCVKEHKNDPFSMKGMLLYSLIVFIAMLPLFLLNYPGTMTVDSFDQLRQVRNIATYSDHHPWIHTMIIKAFFKIGEGLSGSAYGGIGAYVLFQMFMTALSVGYSASMLNKLKENRIWSIIVILSFVLYPYHLAYSITIWKDILFADMVLVLTVTMYKIIVEADIYDGVIKVWDIILLGISGTGMCLLRHNGLYAYILSALIVIIALLADTRKKKANAMKRLLQTVIIVAVTLCLAFVVKGPVQRFNNVEKGDYAHNLAIPLQQIGRAVSHNGTISDSDMAELEKINSIIYIRNNYEPGGADNMIQWLVAGDSAYFELHKADYLGVWLHIGLNNPVEYFKAYADQTKGYYTTMMPEQIAYYGILPNEDGLDNQPVVGAGVRIKINELCSKLQNMIPVYGVFNSMGACLMILMLWMAVAILNRDYSRLLTTLPVLMLTLTILIATPLVADLRYAYPLMLCFPTLTAILIGTER